ncbi:plasma-membrane proton-efflux P-type ATPase [Mycolicibacterium chubuense NBB4]|uniref:Plasma-membrane proton-efflux P-type ATPase n=1 Tax=Mycolicibacterium chubuense (strain NBB4) TaxID=710421 RepID=I4BGP0_MYCCN|nr:plasma-membrane proton-efflux P-type ATPase [Mycolicibacterium chubuense]AFM16447.1 plasma-membrane proton-efflux P-type ATPase [Mycolicibacterium chubuense NBB4]
MTSGPPDTVGTTTGPASDSQYAGLTSVQARSLLAERGPNTVPEQGRHPVSEVIKSLWAPVPWMLEATIVLEAVLGRWLDAAIVGVVLVFNAGLGYVQQRRAASALALLRRRLEVNARVCRDGAWQSVPAAQLVDGDLVHVRVGDLAPADLLVHSGDVLVDQASLTGESVPVERGCGAAIYASSVIARGEATASVTATGPRTFYGRTAELVRSAESADHLAAVVLRIVRVFIAIDVALAIAGTVFLAIGGASAGEIASFAVVLLLASVPVALPAAFALAGALGARHLAGRGILTARLAGVADAAEMDVLCVDKTGTITRNQLVVEAVTARAGAGRGDVLAMAAVASDRATQDPIDLAILDASADRALPEHHRIAFVPFDPATKRSEATLQLPGGTVRVTKGAPHVIAQLAGQPVDPALERLAADGARVLAVAATDAAGTWRELGLVALADPPRPDAASLIAELTALGIRVIMVSGDSAATAASVAARVGISGPVVRAGALQDASSARLDAGVIAEVLPEDKFRIVRQLQSDGHTVGMTGDGVNDAPALRQADVGIAVAGATDVAKSSAAIVLTGEGLTDIVGLVEESRRTHQRSLTYALNVSVKKLEVPLVLTFGVFVWHQFVFTPLLMALLLLGNDVVSMAITTDRADYAQRPDTWNVRNILSGAAVVAAPLLAASLGLLWWGRDLGPRLDLDHLRTLVFFTLIVSSQATIYLVRSRKRVWASRPATVLVTATLMNFVAALALALTGTLMSALSVTVTAVAVVTVAAAALIADTVKVPTFTMLGLHRLWRPRT